MNPPILGWTPLHAAAEAGNEEVVEILVGAGATVGLCTDTGSYMSPRLRFPVSNFSEGSHKKELRKELCLVFFCQIKEIPATGCT